MQGNQGDSEQMIAQSGSRQGQRDMALLYPVSSELRLAGCRAWLLCREEPFLPEEKLQQGTG